MRVVLLGASAIFLGACATVSMTPGEQTVLAEATSSQTALRTASDAYCDNTEQKGWVTETGNILGFARILIHGDKSETVNTTPDYAELIGAGTAAPEVVFTQIEQDAIAARAGLADVNREARALLTADITGTANRTDVMSFEHALVNAQKSYRSFARAADIVVQAHSAAPSEMDDALNALTDEIDAARSTADRLAERYASLTRNVS